MLKKLYDILEEGNKHQNRLYKVKREYENKLDHLMYR